MAVKLELELLSGPLEGERVALDPKVDLRIGRSPRGLNLPDPLVSVQHAVLQWSGDSYWITDLGSATGTEVNGRPIEPERSIRLELGARIRIGETEMRLVEPSARPWVLAGLVVAALLVTIPLVAQTWFVAVEPLAVAIVPPQPVRGLEGEAAVLELPVGLLRREGFDPSQVRVDSVTDVDGDGVDEFWLLAGSRRLVFSLGEHGAWRPHGIVPATCTERPGVGGAELVCGGLVYGWTGDAYALRRLEGAVAWMRRPEATPVGNVAEPFAVTPVQLERLVRFLADRGVEEPVHALYCEGTLQGLRAQALTASGRLVALEPGCGSVLSVGGEPALQGASVFAVALTAAGYEAVLADLAFFLGGDEDGLFRSDGASQWLARARGAVQLRVAARLEVMAERVDGASAVAPEQRLRGARRLLRTASAAPEPPLAKTANLLSPGVARVSGEGCVELELETGPYACLITQGCTEGSVFLQVREVGCQAQPVPVLAMTYGQARAGGRAAGVEVSAALDTVAGMRRVDVLRARVSYRTPSP